MADRVMVTWQAREYEVVHRPVGQSGEPAAVWQVIRDGAVLTSFPAGRSDDAAEVQEKAVGWLEGNGSRPAADVGRQ